MLLPPFFLIFGVSELSAMVAESPDRILFFAERRVQRGIKLLIFVRGKGVINMEEAPEDIVVCSSPTHASRCTSFGRFLDMICVIA